MSAMPPRISLPRPADDMHLHLRDGAKLEATVGAACASGVGRALIMPNLKPPVTTAALALEYRARILAAAPAGHAFTPLMTLYLTDRTSAADIAAAAATGVIPACKLYPAGATTNSAHGVTDVANVDGALAAMSDAGMVLCVHGEVTAPEVDIFDR